MKMKKIVLAMVVALMGTIVMNAQPPCRPDMSSEQMMEKRVERLDKQLGLTEQQKVEVARIYAEEMKTMQKMKAVAMEPKNATPDRARRTANREKMRDQHKATDAKIKALLTPEQAAKYDQLKKEQGKRRHGKGHHGDARKGQAAQGGCNGDCTCKNK